MRILLRLMFLIAMIFFGGVIFIKYTYGCSWQESFEIADQFIADLMG